MSEVWKYKLSITDEQVVEMPPGAELLHVDEQEFGSLALWARVIPDEPPERRSILVRGTGHPVGAQPHIGTVLSVNGLVWHVFDGGVDIP